MVQVSFKKKGLNGIMSKFVEFRQQLPYAYDYQITIEKTPGYFRTVEAPKRVFEMNPSIKLILIVRNPVTRIVSHFTHLLTKELPYDPNKYESESKFFEDLVFYKNGSVKIKDKDFDTIKFKTTLIYDSLYSIHLENWLQYFPINQIHVVDGEEFIKNPFKEIKKVEEFLGLSPFINENDFIYNPNKKFYCFKRKNNKNSMKCLQKSKGRVHPEIESNLLEKLKEFLKPFDQKFFFLIQQKPFWI